MNNDTLCWIAGASLTLAWVTFVYCLHCIRDREAKKKRIEYLEKQVRHDIK